MSIETYKKHGLYHRNGIIFGASFSIITREHDPFLPRTCKTCGYSLWRKQGDTVSQWHEYAENCFAIGCHESKDTTELQSVIVDLIALLRC